MKKNDKNEIPITTINSVIEEIVNENIDGKICIDDVLLRLNSPKNETLANRILRSVEGDGRFFIGDDENFVLKTKFFHNFTFIVTPDEWEIENNVFIPGHRFSPFLSEEVFPSEVNLNLSQIEMSIALDKVFHYHYLLGSEQIFDFLIAENPANKIVKNYHSNMAAPEVKINVFDMKSFYLENDFCYGDAIVIKVLDYDNGICEYSYLSGSERSGAGRKNSVTLWENAMKKVIDKFEEYFEIPEQLSYGCFFIDEKIKNENNVSIDELISMTINIEMSFEGEHTTLRWRSDDIESDSFLPPEGVSISQGNTESPETMLKEIGAMLTMDEIDGFILDCCNTYALEFEEFFSRAFGNCKLNFTDEGQEVSFMNFLEDKFEQLTSSYDRYEDEYKAPLRNMIIEMVEERLEYLYHINSEELSNDSIKEKIKKLVAISHQLNEILRQLNNTAFTPSEEDCNDIRKIIEQRLDDQEQLLNYD